MKITIKTTSKIRTIKELKPGDTFMFDVRDGNVFMITGTVQADGVRSVPTGKIGYTCLNNGKLHHTGELHRVYFVDTTLKAWP